MFYSDIYPVPLLSFVACLSHSILYFSEFSIFCDHSLASTGLFLVILKVSSQKEWLYTLISDQMSCSPICRGWVAVNWEKNTIFNDHPVNIWQVFTGSFKLSNLNSVQGFPQKDDTHLLEFINSLFFNTWTPVIEYYTGWSIKFAVFSTITHDRNKCFGELKILRELTVITDWRT